MEEPGACRSAAERPTGTYFVNTETGVIFQMVADQNNTERFRVVPFTGGDPETAIAAKPDRYRMDFSPFVRADTFMVDTEAGRVWQIAADKDGSIYLQAMTLFP